MLLNIFKIEEYFDYEILIKKINEKISCKGNKMFSFNEVIYENKVDDVKIYAIYGVTNKTNSSYSWEKIIIELFNFKDVKNKTINSSYGLIVYKYNNEIYIISFGRANTLISEFIDINFGLKMASMVMNEKTIITQSSKFFSMAKSKSITEYNNTNFNTDFSESVDCLRGDLQEYPGRECIENLSNIIKLKKVKFTTSMEVDTRNEYINFDDLYKIILNISKIFNTYEERIHIPRLIPIRKNNSELLTRLNDKLDKALIFKDKYEDAKISVAFYKLDNSKFIFESDVLCYKLYKERKSKNNLLGEFETINIDVISECLKNNNIDSIERVKVEIINVDGFSVTKKISEILDIIIKLDDSDVYYIFDDGRWNRFNLDFLKKIDDEIKDINNSIVRFDSEFNYSKDKVKECIKNNDLKFKKIIEKGYREIEYNFWLSLKNKWQLFDRKQVNKLEICDLYADNRNLIHVKFGNPANFKDCIEQSKEGVLDYINNPKDVDKKLGISNVDEVTLLLITDNIKVLETQDIANFNSLSLKISLIYWKKFVMNYNLKPKIIIGKEIK